MHTDPIYPCKYSKIRSILCYYLRKQYLTILVLILPYIDCFENFYFILYCLNLTGLCVVEISTTHKLWKYFRFFVKIRSMQDGFSGFLQHVGSVIRLIRSYVSQKTVISLLSIATLTILTEKIQQCSTIHSIQCKNSCFPASNLFYIFTQSIKFYKSHYHILKITDV